MLALVVLLLVGTCCNVLRGNQSKIIVGQIMKAFATAILTVIVATALVTAATPVDASAARAHQDEVDALSDKAVAAAAALAAAHYQKMLPILAKRDAALRAAKGFWTTALLHHPDVPPLLGSDDRAILQHLNGIRVVAVPGEGIHDHHHAIEMYFEPNPFFSDEKLWREVDGQVHDDTLRASGINWHAGMEPEGVSILHFFAGYGSMPEEKEVQLTHIIRHAVYSRPFHYYDVAHVGKGCAAGSVADF
jgi:hypothetical protein